MTRVAAALAPWLLFLISTDAFSILKHRQQHVVLPTSESRKEMQSQRHLRLDRHSHQHLTSAVATAIRSTPSADISENVIPTGESYSTLTLLEHIHLLTPNVHRSINNITNGDGDDGRNTKNNNNIIDFFVNTMGFGLDPKSATSINKESGVVFINCGASQLHLNDDIKYCKQMDTLAKGLQETNAESKNLPPLFEIGLRYNNLSLLKEGLSKAGDSCSYEIIKDERSGGETIRVTDAYGRTFVLRQSQSVEKGNSDEPTISSLCQQKVIRSSKENISSYGADIVEKYGSGNCQTAMCQGMDYIEFFVPVDENDKGKTMKKIAKFYDFFFDAITAVVCDGTSLIAVVGFGKVDSNGRAEQSLLFRETLCSNPPKAGGLINDNDLGTGHHIAVYVGANDDDFEVAATNFMDGGLLWVNSQFEDRVLDVDSAMKMKQFRFKDIIDIETGDVLYVLEHEIRSVSHDLFPGKQ